MATEEPKTTAQEMRGFRSPQYREITPTAFFGGIRLGFIEATIITSKLSAIDKMFNGKDVVEHTEEISIHLTPQQAKLFAAWLLKYIRYYEDIFGKTDSEEELNKRGIPLPKEVSIPKLEEILGGL